MQHRLPITLPKRSALFCEPLRNSVQLWTILILYLGNFPSFQSTDVSSGLLCSKHHELNSFLVHIFKYIYLVIDIMILPQLKLFDPVYYTYRLPNNNNFNCKYSQTSATFSKLIAKLCLLVASNKQCCNLST